MAPPIASGRQKESFVKWIESTKSTDRAQGHVGEGSTLTARKKKPASQTTVNVMEETELERFSDRTEVPHNLPDSDNERDFEPEVGALLKRPPQVPKLVSTNTFLPPRAIVTPTCIPPLPTAPISLQENARRGSSSPQARPLKRVQHHVVEEVDDAPSNDLQNTEDDTLVIDSGGKFMEIVHNI